MAIKDGKWVFEKQPDLQSAVRRFFEILDGKETSSNDVTFNPVKLHVEEDGKAFFSSVRVFKTAELEHLFNEMKEFAGYAGKTVRQ